MSSTRFLHRSATVTGVSTGVLVGMYVIDLAAQLADPLAPLRFISAFHHYRGRCGTASTCRRAPS